MWQWAEGHKYLTAAVLTITFIVVIGLIAEATNKSGVTQTAAGNPSPTPTKSASEAALEFKELMDLSETGNLVSSYTFSDAERVIYVTDVWYSMNVQFKKDFLAKVAMLQEAINGRHSFEVRNDHSNEKVGEVTAFGGSLEVYK